MGARGARKTAIQERWTLGKLKNRPGKQDGRPDRKKTVGTGKTAAGNRQNRFLRFRGPRDGWTERRLRSYPSARKDSLRVRPGLDIP
jgi:hypothetical protein